jgi:hypothetical protein
MAIGEGNFAAKARAIAAGGGEGGGRHALAAREGCSPAG